MTVGEVFSIVDRIAYLVEKCQRNKPLDNSDIDSIIDYLDLMANGFTRKEAVSIAGEYVCTLYSK